MPQQKQFLNEFKESKNIKIIDYMAFSSLRKLSGMTFSKNKSTEEAIVFGAPEFILKNLTNKI